MAPEIPQIPSLEKVRQFLIGMVWSSGSAMVTAITVVGIDVWYNEFTDWRKLRMLCVVSAGKAAYQFWEKYKAWLLPPPGTELEKSTESTIRQRGQEPITIHATEKVDVVPKDDTAPKSE